MRKKSRGKKRTGVKKVISGALSFLISVTICIIPTCGFSANLNLAKVEGLVGETDHGYVATVGTQSVEAKKLVEKINEKRKARYQRIAEDNGVGLSIVAQQAGKKLIARTPKGQYIRISGDWRLK